MKKIPAILIWFRLLAGVVIVLLSFTQFTCQPFIIISLMAAGLLSDIFDGIIARRLGVSTEKMRRWDSSVDQVFWCCIVVYTIVAAPLFYKTSWVQVAILAGLEALCYAISYVRFRKEVATHAILSKIWTLLLFSTLVELVRSGSSSVLWQCCFIVGVITRVEIIAILMLIREWTNDVPSVYAAIRLRNGKPVKRNKLFNG